MSAIYGTNLATDGLEILLDPNNPGSYPGTGDDIFDLSFIKEKFENLDSISFANIFEIGSLSIANN